MTAIVLVACVPLGLLLAWHTAQTLREREERLLRSLQDSSHALATQIEAELDASADLLDVLAASGLAQRLEAPEGRLRDARLRRPLWHSLFVDEAAATGVDRQPGVAAQGREVTAVPAGPDSEPAVRISVNAGEGRRLGAWIKLRQWLDLVAATTPAAAHSAGGFVAVLDERRRVIAGSIGAAAVSPQVQRADVVPAFGSGVRGSGRGPAADGTATYAAWQQLRLSGWSVVVGVPAAPVDTEATAAVLTSLVATAGCLVLGLALAWRVARRVTRPLATLAHGEGLPPTSPVQEVAALQVELAATRARDRAALRTLQEQADELEAAFETSPVPMALCLDTGCASGRHNRAMRGLLGTWQSPLPEMLRDGRRIEPGERALHAAANQGLSAPSHEQEWRFPAPVGNRWVLVQAEPLLDAHGRPRGAIEAVVDITPLKRAMQRLAQARDRLQQAQHLIDAAQLVGRVGFLRYDFQTDELRPTRGLVALFNAGAEAPLFDESGHGILSAGVALQAPQTLASWLRQFNAGDRLAMQ
ncbi:MAG TPA: hypothetical protein VEZ89_05605, partial [Rubrivivax sp.]|nr:hypothetical protein [Rubrivivax sp.]